MRYVVFLVSIAFFALRAGAYTEGDVPAAKLLEAAKQGQLFPETLNKFQTDVETAKNISMYGLKTVATTWTADLDIDCDGAATTNCNSQRDPWFQNQLSIGTNLKAEEVPYFVIPIGSPANSSKRGIAFGQIAAVIYNNQVVFAIFVDECGVSSLIGEGSYATAKLLGVNPDPKNGGTDGPVTFIVFTGTEGRITNKADYASHAKAIEIGNARAKALMDAYGISYGSTQTKPDVGRAAMPEKAFHMTRTAMEIRAEGNHSVVIRDMNGHTILEKAGQGPQSYALEKVQPGLYMVQVNAQGSVRTEKVAVF